MARILLIEDEPPLQVVVRDALEYVGHTVNVAGDGKAGLIAFKAGNFDLVMTDCVMPQMEGIETMMAIRKLAPHTKIIAMSGGGRGRAIDYLRIAHNLGAQGTLQKPFSVDELLNTVKAALEAPA